MAQKLSVLFLLTIYFSVLGSIPTDNSASFRPKDGDQVRCTEEAVSIAPKVLTAFSSKKTRKSGESKTSKKIQLSCTCQSCSPRGFASITFHTPYSMEHFEMFQAICPEHVSSCFCNGALKELENKGGIYKTLAKKAIANMEYKCSSKGTAPVLSTEEDDPYETLEEEQEYYSNYIKN